MTTSDTQELTQFKIWLAEAKSQLADSAAKITLPSKIAPWFELLEASLNQQDLIPFLKQLSLPQSTLARLFLKTSELLPADKPSLLQELFISQNRIMAATEKLQPSSFSPQQEVEAMTMLTQRLWQISKPDQLQRQAIHIIAEIFNLSNINLILIKSDGQGVNIPGALWKNISPPHEDLINFAEQVAQPESLVQQVIKNARPQLKQQSGYQQLSHLKNIAQELAVPLIMRGQVIGVLHTFSYSPGQLEQADVYLLDAIATQLVTAMENAQLQTTARQRMREQKILLESNAALGSSMSIENVFNLLATKITEALQAGACVISQWQEEDRTLTPLAQYIKPEKNAPKKVWRILNKATALNNDPIGQQALKTLRPIAMQAHQAMRSDGSLPAWAEHGWASILAFPLVTKVDGKKKILGLIEAYDQKANRSFSLEDIQLGKTLANQANIVIERVELFQETRQRLSEVSTLFTLSNQITSTLNLNELLNHIVTTIQQIVDCRACVLFLLDQSGEYLEIKAAAGLKNRWRSAAKLAVGEGAAGEAVALRKTIYISDTTKDPSYIFFDQSVRSLIVVPMVFQDQVIGAINLDDTRPNAFKQSQEKLLSIAANQAAIAIKNATLFNQVLTEEKQTRAIIQHMADGILMINQRGEIVKVNPALSFLLGLHPAEIVGQNVNTSHLPPKLAAICAAATEKQRTGVLAQDVTLPGEPPLILRIFTTTVTNKDNEPIGEIRVVHDVTQERELERMKDDFVSTISHELRTPLFSIQGFARLILDGDVPDAETQREFLGIIERQATQLTELVNNLLDLRKLADGILSVNMQETQLINTINQTILKLQGFAHKENVKLSANLPDTLPEIMADPQRIEQVLTNLVGNAIKFTPAGGNVLVQAEANHTHITISVTDTGIGISEKNLEYVFGKFYQAEEASTRSVKGSGLGLHISKELIERHNGKIWVESEIGKGSVFYIQLPLENTTVAI